MSDDLTAPGYRPEYTGYDASIGDVGTGENFGTDLFALYKAGRNELPAIAEIYAGVSWKIHFLQGHMTAAFSRPAQGRHRAYLRLLELRDETHIVLQKTSERMMEIGQAW